MDGYDTALMVAQREYFSRLAMADETLRAWADSFCRRNPSMSRLNVPVCWAVFCCGTMPSSADKGVLKFIGLRAMSHLVMDLGDREAIQQIEDRVQKIYEEIHESIPVLRR